MRDGFSGTCPTCGQVDMRAENASLRSQCTADDEAHALLVAENARQAETIAKLRETLTEVEAATFEYDGWKDIHEMAREALKGSQ